MKKKWKPIAPAMAAILVLSVVSTQSSCAQDTTTQSNSSNTQTTQEAPMGTPPSGGAPGSNSGSAPGGSSSAVTSYTAVKSITSDTTLSNQTIASTGTDENAIYISNGAAVTMNQLTVTRTSSDSTGGDNSSFYGVGAAILNTSGKSILTNSNITTNAKGGAGVFSYADGITYVSDTVINTTQDTSGGIHVAGGGTLYAWDVTATTEGESSAAIRSDRGGGTLVADGGTYTSKGTGSPAIYSTADIAVNQATLSAEGSEAICIEGRNSIHLFDSSLTGNMPDSSQNDCTWNVILYQSMSGDSEEGNSTFEMNGGSLTANNGGMFYTTNTESTITLKDVTITPSQDQDFFLRCTGNANQRGWGTTGSNGADCLFTGISQEMEGDVIWDSISQLDFYMTAGSTLTGAVTQDETYAGDGGSGYCSLYISDDSTWIVTKDSTVSKLYQAGTIQDADGKSVTIKGTDGTVYATGDSDITITVTEYNNTADLSGASSVTSWSDYAVQQPSVSANTTTGNTTASNTSGSTSNTTASNTSGSTSASATQTKAAVKSTKIQSVKRSKNNKSMTVKLKKVKGVSGYQIRYATSKKCAKNNSVTVKTKKLKKKITKLSAKKVYYVKARSYKVVNGKTYYSSWTKVKKVKRNR